MKFQQAASGGVLLMALAMSAFAQAPGVAQQSDSDITQPGEGSGDSPDDNQLSDPQQEIKAIMDVQSKLDDQGYHNDDGAGNWGQSSMAALQEYQADHGLQPSGDLDSDTAVSLGISFGEFSAFETAVGEQPRDQESEPGEPDTQPLPSDQEPDDDSGQEI